MKKAKYWILWGAAFLLLLSTSCRGWKSRPSIVIAADASSLETLAAKEIRRYFYLRTGALLPLVQKTGPMHRKGDAVVVANKDHAVALVSPGEGLDRAIAELHEQEYLLRTVSQNGKTIILIVGGSDVGTLYGAYRLAENLGIRFELAGDIIPDDRLPLRLPVVDETGRPLFRLRGIHPFHDFPEGPDWWNLEDFKAYLAQLPKLRMNFIGLHTYPEGHPNAEPTVWIGTEEDIADNGSIRFAYPSSYMNTARGNWGYEPARTGDYHFGAAELFPEDDYGPEVMNGLLPEPKTVADSIAVFERTGKMLGEAFSFGRTLGIRTCVGTESPLTIPEWVKKRLVERGKKPEDRAVVKELYRGIFRRITKAYPLDYYWIWTDENWTWSDADPEKVKAVAEDILTALEAADEVRPPFSFATCGWVLGPPGDRRLFDRILPKEVALSTINREVGKAPLDPAFGRISGRSKWAIPWLEDDPALTSPQLWVGRMRRDAFDALAYGCDGLLGIHWRTRVLGPNISALAQAAWNQTPWAGKISPASPAEGPTNGVYVSLPGAQIPGTSEPEIYRDYRDRVFGYRLPLPRGTYNLKLKFVEGEIKEKGRRVFDISLEGKKVKEKVDIFASAGAFRPMDLEFKRIQVEDGSLDIEFADRIHYPAVAGIVIQNEKLTKKINCGGPAVKDYDPDWPETPRFASTLDFYDDWAKANFGTAAGPEIGAVFSSIDGRLPQLNIWTGPGGIRPEPRPWEEVKKEFGFVEELASFKPKVTGRGAVERFNYWLSTFTAMRETARLECLWADYHRAEKEVKAQAEPRKQALEAEEKLLPIREKMVRTAEAIYESLLATISTPGELGTVMNWEQHLLPAVFLQPGKELEKILGRKLPPSAELPRVYRGEPRIIVPTKRTLLDPGETLRLRVIILASELPAEAVVGWRALGGEKFSEIPLRRIGRGVYEAICPDTKEDLEYYIRARFERKDLFFPPTSPEVNQTIVRRSSERPS